MASNELNRADRRIGSGNTWKRLMDVGKSTATSRRVTRAPSCRSFGRTRSKILLAGDFSAVRHRRVGLNSIRVGRIEPSRSFGAVSLSPLGEAAILGDPTIVAAAPGSSLPGMRVSRK